MTRLTGPVSAFCLAPLLLPVATAHAQDTVAFASRAAIAPGAARREIEAVRVRTTPPVIDGRLDDEAWTAASAATGFTQLEPRPGEPATQLSEARIAYDEDAIYVAARLPDTHPDSIVAQLSRRDDEVHSDWFYVAFDSYHDRRTAFVFAVNPRGVKLDAFLYNDTQDDESWDAVWDVATRIDSAGWTAEFRIPLSQLRFSAVGESAAPEYRWGVNFARRIARRNEFSFWAPVPPDASGLVSLFGELTGLRGLRPPRRLELLPYSVARLTREPGEAANPFYRENALFGSLGADLKYGITSDLTLTASLNPDFGQVEADPSQVNLTAYESFFPEKRPFFIEGADIFQFGIGLGDGDSGSEQLFYSRRVGRPPQHTPSAAGGFVDVPAATTILGAAKLSGKTRAGWSVGVLSALTAAEEARLADSLGAARRQAAEPLSHYGVARLIKDFRQGQSALGAILTAANRRLDDQAFDFLPSAGYAAGVDGRHRFGGDNYEVSGWLLGSYVVGSDSAIARAQRASSRYFQRPDAAHVEYRPDRNSLSGLAGNLQLFKISGGHWRWGAIGHFRSPEFEVNDLGFQRSADMVLQVGFIGYEQFRPGEFFRRWNANVNQWAVWNFGGDRPESGVNANGSFQHVSFWGGYAGVNREMGPLSTDALRGGPALRKPGRTNTWFGFYSDSRKPWSVGLNGDASFEDETGGNSLGFRPRLTLRPSRRTELSLQPGLSRSLNPWQYVAERKYQGRPHYFFGRLDQTTAWLTTRLSYTFSPDLSLQLYAQPFVSAGRYSQFREVREPRAERFHDRFHTLQAGEITYDTQAERYRVDLDGNGTGDVSFGNPDFNFKQFRSNLVLRWEYRPGSTLFLVWTQGRTARDSDGSFRLGRDLGRMFGAAHGYDIPVTNVLLLKVNYWLDL